MANVKFFFGTQEKYNALNTYDDLALYFITDTQRLYRGGQLFATGAMATSATAGLMSSNDKKSLDELVATSGSAINLQPVDGSISVIDGENGVKKIGVAISAEEGNALSLKNDGLFVKTTEKNDIPEYTLEQQAIAEGDFLSTYKLKKTLNGEISYVGDPINIPKVNDKYLQSAVLKTVEEDGKPYEEAKLGDKYIDMTFNDAEQSHIYVPLGNIGGDVSADIKVDKDNANGLYYSDNAGLAIALASDTQNGAMSKEMFTSVNKLVELDIQNKYATKEDIKSEVESAVSKTVGTPNAEQFEIDENGVLTLKNIDAAKVIYNGQKLSDVIDEMSNSYTWEEISENVNANVVNAADTLTAVGNNATVNFGSGVVETPISVNKSMTINGENSGINQNFLQKV